jgi:hypothetical protein
VGMKLESCIKCNYEHCGRMSSDGEHQCNYRGGICKFAHTKRCSDYQKCDCELCEELRQQTGEP